MQSTEIIQGRCVGPVELARIRGWLTAHPDWNRTRLSRELCAAWDWRNGAGRLKDMACRSLLLKLEARGRILLPPRQRPSVNGRRNRSASEVAHEASPIQGSLSDLRPLELSPVGEGSREADLFGFLLARHHYLGHRNCVGENLKYLVRERAGRPVACLLFGSVAWQCRPRDAFIGWKPEQRRRQLHRLANNTRFLILPWIKVRFLATHVLGAACARLSADWRCKYGHGIELLETFVQEDRFAGTSYRAAGWIPVGATTGRGRNHPEHTARVPVKEVWLKPLSRDFRGRLSS